jgi:anti-sigma factor RsiW
MPESECQEYFNQLSDYLNDELAAPLRTAMDHHLAGCPDCQVVIVTTRKTVSLYRRYGPAELPAGVTERLWQVLAQAGLCQPETPDPPFQ